MNASFVHPSSVQTGLTISLLTVPSPKFKNKEHHSKVLFNSFPMNGHILGFCPWNQKLENFVSPRVSLWKSKAVFQCLRSPYYTFALLLFTLQVFVANRDATSVVTLNLKPSMATRFVRLVPVSWRNFICVRLELYGCPYGTFALSNTTANARTTALSSISY